MPRQQDGTVDRCQHVGMNAAAAARDSPPDWAWSAHHPGPDGRLPGRGDGGGRVGRGRPRLAAGRGDVAAGLARRGGRTAARRPAARQPQLLLPCATRGRSCARGGLARSAAAVLRRAGAVVLGDLQRPGSPAVRRGGGRRGRGAAARGRQLPFRPAARAPARARAARGRAGVVVGDDGGRGAVAGRARRRRDHRAGPRGGRPSRRVPARGRAVRPGIAAAHDARCCRPSWRRCACR